MIPSCHSGKSCVAWEGGGAERTCVRCAAPLALSSCFGLFSSRAIETSLLSVYFGRCEVLGLGITASYRLSVYFR